MGRLPGRRTVSCVNLKNLLPSSQDLEKLAEYAGDCYSDELTATYNVAVERDGLVLKAPIKSRYISATRKSWDGFTGSGS